MPPPISSVPVRRVLSIPAICNPADINQSLIFKTTADSVDYPGARGFYQCTAVNTYTPVRIDSAQVIAALGYTPENVANKSTDGTFTANSDTLYPSQKAVKTFVTAMVTGLLDLKGSTDCSGNPNYPAASKGDCYVVSVAGKIGGAPGITVGVGDFYFALADNAGGTQASVGTSYDVLEFNLVGALLAANNLSDLSNAGTALTNLGISAFIKTLLDDADAAAARTTLGVTPGITNSAGANVLPRTVDGSGNLGPSQFADDGSDATIGGAVNPSGFAAGSQVTSIGDWNGNGNSAQIRVENDTQTATFNNILILQLPSTTDVTASPTINTPLGIVRIPAAASSVTITSANVTANSIIQVTLRTIDTTLKSAVAVPSSGSIVITGNAVATANIDIQILILTPA